MGLTKLCAADKNALCCRQKFLRELTGTRSGLGNAAKLGYSVIYGIDTVYIYKAAKLFRTEFISLKTLCSIHSYDGALEQVTHAIVLHLWVDGRRQKEVPMLILNLGQ